MAQDYMPTNALLRDRMDCFEKYDIERIFPQHGSILEGGNVKETIEKLKTTLCACDVEEVAGYPG